MKTMLLIFVLFFQLMAMSQTSPLFPQDGKTEYLKNFWVKVFTQFSDEETLLHDEVEPWIVYAVINHKGMEHFQRQKKVSKELWNIKNKLTKIAKKSFNNLKEDEKELLSNIPQEKHNKQDFKKLLRQLHAQQGMSNRFRDGLMRSSRFIKSIEEVLTKYNLPVELAALPHVESSFSYFATSKVGAAGIWQLMPRTARHYKLRVTDRLDDRLDPIKATEVAVKLLRDNFKIVKSWPLAITAYNHGTKNILKTIRELKTHNPMVVLDSINKKSFKFASRNFYPSYLAALEVAQNKKIFFPELSQDNEQTIEEFITERRMNISTIAKKLKLSVSELKSYNPQITGVAWKRDFSLPKGFVIKYAIENTVLAAKTTSNHAKILTWPELKNWFDQLCGVYRTTIASILE